MNCVPISALHTADHAHYNYKWDNWDLCELDHVIVHNQKLM